MTLERAFGEALLRRRRAAELSQEELAFRSGINRSHISELENARRSPSLQTVMALAAGLGMQAAELVGEVERSLEG